MAERREIVAFSGPPERVAAITDMHVLSDIYQVPVESRERLLSGSGPLAEMYHIQGVMIRWNFDRIYPADKYARSFSVSKTTASTASSTAPPATKRRKITSVTTPIV